MHSKSFNFSVRVIITTITVFIVLMLYHYNIVFSSVPEQREQSRPDTDFFKTAKGNVTIQEVEKEIFLSLGFTVLDNTKIIPVVKQITEKKCSEWSNIPNDTLLLDPPKELEPRRTFTLNYYVPVFYSYYNNTPNSYKREEQEMRMQIWEKSSIEEWIVRARSNNFTQFRSSYVDGSSVYYATKYYHLKGQTGCVIGSLKPWVETICLINGAKKIYTIDYNILEIGHPSISFVHALDFRKNFDRYIESFDFVVSYSSIEHSGLGRFGDPLDPYGDIKEMHKVLCMLKQGGLFFLGVPLGLDAIGFNSHRIYGRIRLALLFAGFDLINIFDGNNEAPHILRMEEINMDFDGKHFPHWQPVFVLRKPFAAQK